MSDNLDKFLVDLDKIGRDLPAFEVQRAHRKYHLTALSRVVLRTPVDTGVTRGNWQSTIGSPATGVLPKRSAAEVQSEGQAVIANVPAFGISFISNNADHIEVLENGGFVPPNPGPSKDPRKGRKGRTLVEFGYSVQAPQGMVAITAAELDVTPLEQL